MKKNKLNIAIIGTLPFPFGFAETCRLILYTRGILELFHNIRLLCLYPTEFQHYKIKNKHIKGKHEGIDYEYTCRTTAVPANKLKNYYLRLIGLKKSIIKIYRYNKIQKIDAIIIASRETPVIFAYYLFSRFLCIPIIHEAGEYPFLRKTKSFITKIDKFLYIQLAVKLFDGIFSPTKALLRYFRNILPKSKKLALITMMVASDKFVKKDNKDSKKSPYIAYCGDLGYNKDGVPILVKAFKIISEKHNRLKLFLIGSTMDKKGLNNLKKQVKELGLNSRIIFTGRIKHKEIPDYICNAKLLVLSRPANKQAEGGFPGKLGEYLATGNPVVVTRVGEIPDYLTDNKNAFLSIADSAEAFATRMDYALSNYTFARKVGLAGQKLTHSIFHYKTQSQILIDFIYTFLR